MSEGNDQTSFNYQEGYSYSFPLVTNVLSKTTKLVSLLLTKNRKLRLQWA